jgi:hypothetical protein
LPWLNAQSLLALLCGLLLGYALLPLRTLGSIWPGYQQRLATIQDNLCTVGQFQHRIS